MDLSKYFDTLNHEILLNILRRNVKDERVIQWIKRYLKSGVMENGVVMETEEGSPQGGNLSPAGKHLSEMSLTRSIRNGELYLSVMQTTSCCWRKVRAAKRLLETRARNIWKGR